MSEHAAEASGKTHDIQRYRVVYPGLVSHDLPGPIRFNIQPERIPRGYGSLGNSGSNSGPPPMAGNAYRIGAIIISAASLIGGAILFVTNRGWPW